MNVLAISHPILIRFECSWALFKAGEYKDAYPYPYPYPSLPVVLTRAGLKTRGVHYGSHTTLDWITLAHANNIILYCLPPHTTHQLQPLDVGCFGPIQIAWFNRCDEILDETC